jgi:hypothetical protein
LEKKKEERQKILFLREVLLLPAVERLFQDLYLPDQIHRCILSSAYADFPSI